MRCSKLVNLILTLNKIYKDLGYKVKAKATDLSKFFNTRGASVQDGDKRVHGIRLLSKLEKEGDKE